MVEAGESSMYGRVGECSFQVYRLERQLGMTGHEMMAASSYCCRGHVTWLLRQVRAHLLMPTGAASCCGIEQVM